MGTYSFLNVQATLVGIGGNIQLGAGAAVAEEGITITMKEEKNVQTIGADGSGMNSLNASKAGKISIRLLQTSPINAKLSSMYAIQTASSAAHGLNVISVRDPVSGDSIVATQCAFSKFPTLTYAKNGTMREWEFDAITIDTSLGGGTLSALASFGVGAV
jgi:hypothetical protein